MSNSRQRRFWALCGDPTHYRVEEAVRGLEIDAWTTKGKPIRAGDRVIIWKSKGRESKRGIVAFGEVLTDPELRSDSGNPYWVTQPAPDLLEELVDVRYLLAPGLPLWEPNPTLARLSVSRARGGTVFKISPEQWEEVMELVDGWPLPEDPIPLTSAPSIDLIPHQRYRRRDLHARFGGQRQGGISTPADNPVVMVFSGPSGEEYGYRDGWTEDGLFRYTGEGQRGDMAITRGNAAIAGHADDGRDLLLFESRSKGWVEYLGRMVCVGYDRQTASDIDGNPRQALVFTLAPAEQFQDLTLVLTDDLQVEVETLGSNELAELRRKAAEGIRDVPVDVAGRVRQVWVRSQAVRRYALRRAAGVCEACGRPAPFTALGGEPFLEVHHLRRLSDGGPDRPEAVAAVCPNCHRRCHHAGDSQVFNRKLERHIRLVEAALLADGAARDYCGEESSHCTFREDVYVMRPG